MVAFHGTNEKTAKSILRSGFRPGTYFAKEVQDAAMMGGHYMFAVLLSDNPNERFWGGRHEWEFHLRDALPASAILWHRLLDGPLTPVAGRILT